jgi:hypothetical protein
MPGIAVPGISSLPPTLKRVVNSRLLLVGKYAPVFPFSVGPIFSVSSPPSLPYKVVVAEN